MGDGANFRHLQDALMSQGSNFLEGIHNSLHPLSFPLHKHSPTHAAQFALYIPPPSPDMLEVLLSHPSFCTPATISCLSQSGQYILSQVGLSAGSYEPSYVG
jgi:hypothetical protein